MTPKGSHTPAEPGKTAGGCLDPSNPSDAPACPLCLSALVPDAECERCADPGAAHEPQEVVR
jgi:hypothetical protein